MMGWSSQATFSISTLNAGNHDNLTAVYNGDSTFDGSTSIPSTVSIAQATTSTSLASALNPAEVAESVTFTATVTSTASGTPTGTVTFRDGTSTLGTGTLTSGTGGFQATFSTSSLSVGSRSITAQYNGDTNYMSSTSSSLSQSIVAWPVVSFATSSATVAEDAGSASLTVTLDSSPLHQALTVNYTTNDGPASGSTLVPWASHGAHDGGSTADYTATSGTLTFATGGGTAQTISVPILNDHRYGDDVYFSATLSSPGWGTLGSPSQETVLIHNTNTPPQVQFATTSFSALEDAGTALVTVTLSQASEKDITVHYKTYDGCGCGLTGPALPTLQLPPGVDAAFAGTDFGQTEGDLTLLAGQSSAAFTVPLIDIPVADSDRGFYVSLTSPQGATLGSGGLAKGDATQDLASVTIRDALATHTYDSYGKLTEVDFPDGTNEQWTYDPSTGQPASLRDGLGRTRNYTYDGNGNRLTETDALGRTTTYTYTAAGLVATMTRPNPGGMMGVAPTTTYSYDSSNRLTQITNPDGTSEQYTYDGNNNRLTQKDERGYTTTFTYNNQNQVATETNPLGGVTTYTYDGNGNVASVTDPLGHTTTMSYDGAGRLLSQTDALGNITSYTYDTAGQLLTQTDPLAHRTTFTYDSSERLLSKTDALGEVTAYSYDDVHHINTMTDALGHTTTSVYDAEGRLLQTVDALGNVTTSSYDAAGQLVSQTDARGDTTTFVYDAAQAVGL